MTDTGHDAERRAIVEADEPWPTDDDAPPRANGAAKHPATEVLRPLAALLPDALARAEHRRAGDEKPLPVPWQSYADALGGGLWPGVHVLVGPTGSGKTAGAVQEGDAAARAGHPVVYVGLELDETQIALRFLGGHAGVRWSSLYLGRCTQQELERARKQQCEAAALPIYIEEGAPTGWPASRLYVLAEAVRKRHPKKSPLFVLDFLQLVGAETADGRTPDLRERIGRAAYTCRDVARKYDAAIRLVSSAARDKYALLGSTVDAAGLATWTPPGHVGAVRTIRQPGILVGLGKESGDIEYAADSVTVLVRWPLTLDSGETAYVCAVPKLRYGPPTWLVLGFDGMRFAELPLGVSDLPQPVRRKGRDTTEGDSAGPADYVARVVETVRLRSGLRSQRQILDCTDGGRSEVHRAIKRALRDGLLERGADGVFRLPVPEPSEKNTNEA